MEFNVHCEKNHFVLISFSIGILERIISFYIGILEISFFIGILERIKEIPKQRREIILRPSSFAPPETNAFSYLREVFLGK